MKLKMTKCYLDPVYRKKKNELLANPVLYDIFV